MTTCKHCQRIIVEADGLWIDPDASGDDLVWRESCDSHDTFVADHEPATTREVYDWAREEAREEAWVEGVAQWELSLIGTPGLFASECHADCLDEMGPEAFTKWYRAAS